MNSANPSTANTTDLTAEAWADMSQHCMRGVRQKLLHHFDNEFLGSALHKK
jgi:hypothetical protein